jgi:hydroxyethylthiazole kinase
MPAKGGYMTDTSFGAPSRVPLDSDALVRQIQVVRDRVRELAPLVHNITNYVVMNNSANALLAFGASPAMVHAVEEVEAFLGISAALVVNIGTLSPPWVEAMQRAGARATEWKVPWVLDPVGAGATPYRTETARALLALRPAVLRGNASEILAVAGEDGATKGVDSTARSDAALDAATRLAHRHGCTVVITGAEDVVTDGARVVRCANGHPMMTRVTGLGCSLTALVGACLAVEPDAVLASSAAVACMGVAGELAALQSAGPGSLQVALLDALYALDAGTLSARARVRGV